ncbi:MAG: lipoyl(octanoyl) transferase LipB [Deltaproteobacteria bacterium]|nr:lipoyl(octanoyl) transferase LipB [Deltaproteobacteria bacterium]MBW2070768.1 lipoyl(octanoyl) transferase LipB [Deltaproteobacteria bacterium]
MAGNIPGDPDRQQPGWIINLGRKDYGLVWELQRQLLGLRQRNQVPDLLLLVEHEPVITLGRRAQEANVLADRQVLRALGIRIYRVERGGDVTYHGPGQLVGYPIIHLGQQRLSVRGYVDLLEELLIQTLAEFSIEAGRKPHQRGIWAGNGKIAAIGVAIKRWVTMHGFSLNISPELSHFRTINPCGLSHEKVTSMASILAAPPNLLLVCGTVAKQFAQLFAGAWQQMSYLELKRELKPGGEKIEVAVRGK